MKINIESTTKIVNLNGIPVRVWEGKTESGIKIHAFITRVAVGKDEDCTQFEKELKECIPPTKEIESYPMSMII